MRLDDTPQRLVPEQQQLTLAVAGQNQEGHRDHSPYQQMVSGGLTRVVYSDVLHNGGDRT